jgi:hypothetical protein
VGARTNSNNLESDDMDKDTQKKSVELNEKVESVLLSMDYKLGQKKRFTPVYKKEKRSLLSRLSKPKNPSFIYECVLNADTDQPDTCTITGMEDRELDFLKGIATQISTRCNIKVNVVHGNEIITFGMDGEIEKTESV